MESKKKLFEKIGFQSVIYSWKGLLGKEISTDIIEILGGQFPSYVTKNDLQDAWMVNRTVQCVWLTRSKKIRRRFEDDSGFLL